MKAEFKTREHCQRELVQIVVVLPEVSGIHCCQQPGTVDIPGIATVTERFRKLAPSRPVNQCVASNSIVDIVTQCDLATPAARTEKNQVVPGFLPVHQRRYPIVFRKAVKVVTEKFS